MPVLIDGDLTLYDSTVILEYLEDAHFNPPLYPREPQERARSPPFDRHRNLFAWHERLCARPAFARAAKEIAAADRELSAPVRHAYGGGPPPGLIDPSVY